MEVVVVVEVVGVVVRVRQVLVGVAIGVVVVVVEISQMDRHCTQWVASAVGIGEKEKESTLSSEAGAGGAVVVGGGGALKVVGSTEVRVNTNHRGEKNEAVLYWYEPDDPLE